MIFASGGETGPAPAGFVLDHQPFKACVRRRQRIVLLTDQGPTATSPLAFRAISLNPFLVKRAIALACPHLGEYT